MIFPGGLNKIPSHQLHEKFSDLKLVRRELPILGRQGWLGRVSSFASFQIFGEYNWAIERGAEVGKANGLSLLLDAETFDYTFHLKAGEGFKEWQMKILGG